MIYKGKTVKIPIGKTIFTGETCFFKNRYYGVTLLLSKPRYGKTSLTKDISCDLTVFRRVAVFDLYEEWERHVLYFNPKAKYPKRWLNAKVVKNFAFKISDYNHPSDWASMGIADFGAKILADLAERIDIHYDNPEEFLKLTQRLPYSEDAMVAFNRKYKDVGLTLVSPYHEVTLRSINSRLPFLLDFFKQKGDGKLYVEDWPKLFLKHNLIISMTGRTEEEKFRAMALTGKIMEKIAPYLKQLKPALIFEEADTFFPDQKALRRRFKGQVSPSSLNKGLEYVTKFQKRGVSVFLISQSEKLLNASMTKFSNSRILGKIPEDDLNYDITKKLKWKPDSNYRQFILLDETGSWTPFVPNIAGCKV